jgi:hypothetical protein
MNIPRGMERNRLQWKFEELPQEERKKLIAAFKARRLQDLDWACWLARELPGDT